MTELMRIPALAVRAAEIAAIRADQRDGSGRPFARDEIVLGAARQALDELAEWNTEQLRRAWQDLVDRYPSLGNPAQEDR